jgi:hypothetical protein
MSGLLREAINTLSKVVNISTGLAHPFDEARAKELFKALKAEGEHLVYDEIKKLAIENGWPDRHAHALAELGQRIGSGGRVVIKSPRDWGESTVKRLKEKFVKVDA